MAVRREWVRYWLVDPLDGTREFVKRNGEFTVNIALIEDHAPVLGVVYAPVRRAVLGVARRPRMDRRRQGARTRASTRAREASRSSSPAAARTPIRALNRGAARIGAHEAAAGLVAEVLRRPRVERPISMCARADLGMGHRGGAVRARGSGRRRADMRWRAACATTRGFAAQSGFRGDRRSAMSTGRVCCVSNRR